jgi:hypothetical protein
MAVGGPPIDAVPGTCTVEFQHMDGWRTNGPYSTAANNLASGMTHYNDRHNHYANLSGCQGHQVISTEHDTNVNRNQVWTFHTGSGKTSLENNWNELSGVMINRIPLDKSNKMVGFANKTDANLICNNTGATVHWHNDRRGELCPNGTFYALNCINGLYACAYTKDEGVLSAQVPAAVKPDMINRVCNKTENLAFGIGGDQLCAHHQEGKAIATAYCKSGNNFITDTAVCKPSILDGAGGYNPLLLWYCGKDGNIKTAKCDVTINANDNKLARTDYDRLAKTFCDANPNDAWCGCYNVMNDKCANDVKTGPMAGCLATAEYVKLRDATPKDFQDVWNGQRKCGTVCAGGNKYLPLENQAGCKTTIQICKQNINVGSMSESEINAKCALNASDGSSAGEPPAPSPAQDSAQSELDEAKAALARGDAGAQERLDAAEAALDAADESAVKPISLTDFRTNPRSYIPNSLDGLKTNRKQQIGAGAMGALVLGCMMMLLLIVASASGGGSVKKRFR